MLAAVRLIHPAPAFAVTLLSAVLGAILLAQEGRPIDERWWLTVLAVAGSQVFTGATNDLADAARDDAAGRTEKPIPAGEVSQNLALWLASTGLAVQVAASAWLGALPLVLGLGAVASAAAYNLALSRTPLSPLPYLISFGLLPLWVGAGVDVPLERVIPAVPLAAAFAAAAHLANTLRDFDSDAATGSRCLAQVIGRGTHAGAGHRAGAGGGAGGRAGAGRGRSGEPGVVGAGCDRAGQRRSRSAGRALAVVRAAGGGDGLDRGVGHQHRLTELDRVLDLEILLVGFLGELQPHEEPGQDGQRDDDQSRQ